MDGEIECDGKCARDECICPVDDDEELILVAEMRMQLDSGKRYSVDEVAAHFGINLDD